MATVASARNSVHVPAVRGMTLGPGMEDEVNEAPDRSSRFVRFLPYGAFPVNAQRDLITAVEEPDTSEHS